MAIDDLRVTRGILVNGSYNIGVLARNNMFYKTILSNAKNISTISGESVRYDSAKELIYDTSNNAGLDNETVQAIMDLLLQLRATQSDQNIFVQNNTVVRQQILDQLKREISQVQNNFTQNQIQQLRVVSNNLFDEDTLNELIKSLLKDTKKKLGYSWDDESDNVLISEPGKSPAVETVIKSVRPVDVIRKYQTILSNTINNVSTDRILYKNNLINRTEIYNKEQRQDELIVREIKQPIEITTDEFIRKENLIESIEKIYNERLIKRLEIIPQVTKTFLKTLESGGIRKYKDLVSTVWDKVYLKKESSETRKLSHRRVTEKTNEVEITQNSIDTYFNKVLIQDVTGLTLYKEIRSAYKNKKLNLKNILVNNRNKDFIETDIVKRYNNITLSTNEKVYKNKLVTEANLINKITDNIINERKDIIREKRSSLYETEVEKVYKKSVFNKDVRNENRITTVKFENEFTNKIENISKKTAEIVINNKLLNRYDDIVEHITEHVSYNTVQNQRNKIHNKTIKQKGVKTHKGRIRDIEKRTIIKEFEEQYQDSIFNVENLKERIFNTKTVSRLRNRLTNLEIINKNHVKNVKKQTEILNRHNVLVSNVTNNVISGREIDNVVLINKDITENTNLTEKLNETQKVSIREVQDKFTQLYKNSVFNLESTINKSVVDKINQNDVVNKVIKSNKKLFRNINQSKSENSVELINKVLVENFNTPKEHTFVNKIINEHLEKDIINKIKFKTKNINSFEKKNLTEIYNYQDTINENNKKITQKYENKNIERVIQRENLINRNVINNVDILEQLPQIQKIQENLINQEVKTRRKDKIYNKNTEYLEKILSNNLLQINEQKINEHVRKFKNKVIDNLTILNMVEGNAKGRDIYNTTIEKKYRENLFTEAPNTILENIKKIYNVNKVIPRKKVNILPPTILQHKTSTINENNIYRDIEQNELSYYNQIVEDIGKTFVVRNNEVLNLDNIIDKVNKQEMIYKEPVKLPKEDSKTKQEKQEKTEKKQKKKIEPILRQAPEEKRIVSKESAQRGLTKNDVEGIIKSYIKNINVDTISRVVINEVEHKMRLDRRRKGII